MTTLEFALLGIVAILILVIVALYLIVHVTGELLGGMIKGLTGWRPEDEDKK